MILSDRTIREELAAGRIVLDPSDESLIQPASVDVRLDKFFRVFLNHTMPVIDVKKNLEELTRLVEIDDERPFVLHPGEFVLGSTLERIGLPNDLVRDASRARRWRSTRRSQPQPAGRRSARCRTRGTSCSMPTGPPWSSRSPTCSKGDRASRCGSPMGQRSSLMAATSG